MVATAYFSGVDDLTRTDPGASFFGNISMMYLKTYIGLFLFITYLKYSVMPLKT